MVGLRVIRDANKRIEYQSITIRDNRRNKIEVHLHFPDMRAIFIGHNCCTWIDLSTHSITGPRAKPRGDFF